MNYEEVKTRVKAGISCLDFLEKAPKGGYICPYCKSGTGNNHSERQATGAVKYYPDTNTWTCHRCNRSGDVLDLYQEKYNTDYKTALITLAERIGLHVDETPHRAPAAAVSSGAQGKTATEAKTPETGAQGKIDALPDFTGYYAECVKRLDDPRALVYLKGRGISQETAARFSIGFDPAADPASAPGATGNEYKAHPAPRLILPTGPAHYVGRRVDGVKEYEKMNPAGTSPAIFNAAAINAQEVQELFITEGTFDALALIEAGFYAIALNSTSNREKFVNDLDAATEKAFVICMDNDKAGRDAAEHLAKELEARGLPYLVANIAGEYKDPSEAWTKDPEALKAECNKARQKIGRPRNTSDYVRNFMAAEVSRFTSDIMTGFKDLDQKAGGLYSGLYVLAAVSSLGKTSFALQLADQLAAAGSDVLFFSLEQSQLELVTKSIARQTAIDSEKKSGRFLEAVTSLDIRKGHDGKQTRTAAQEYINAVKDRIKVIEGNFYCNVDTIRAEVERQIKATGRRPIVFVDYLQILQPPEKLARSGTREIIDANITELKRISRDTGTTIFVISSVNRGNYLNPIDFESLKESGGIEYAADVVLGLQFAKVTAPDYEAAEKITDKREMMKEARRATPRELQFVCLKNRYGIANFESRFLYWPAFDLFKNEPKEGAALETIPEEYYF